MKYPIISKIDFINIISLLQQQYDKDIKFADFMELYLDGRCVPILSDFATLAAMKSLTLLTEDLKLNKSEDSWVDWFAYETDFGKDPKSAFLDEKEYVISSPDEMYEFLVEYHRHLKK